MISTRVILIVSVFVGFLLWYYYTRSTTQVSSYHKVPGYKPRRRRHGPDGWTFGQGKGSTYAHAIVPLQAPHHNAAFCREYCTRDDRCIGAAFDPTNMTCAFYDRIDSFLVSALRPDDERAGIWRRPT